MNLKDDLFITCRTTCGCGNELIPYTKQIETTHYLLTCSPYSDDYKHPLLIAIDKNSPIFEKARKWDKTLAHGLFETGHVTLKDYTSALKLRELIEKEIKRQIEEDHQTPFVLQRLLEESKK